MPEMRSRLVLVALLVSLLLSLLVLLDAIQTLLAHL